MIRLHEYNYQTICDALSKIYFLFPSPFLRKHWEKNLLAVERKEWLWNTLFMHTTWK